MGTRFNVLMTVQIPLKQKQQPAYRNLKKSYYSGSDSESCSCDDGSSDGNFYGSYSDECEPPPKAKQTKSFDSSDSEGWDDPFDDTKKNFAAPKKNSAAPVKSKASVKGEHQRTGTANAARVSKGSRYDEWAGLTVENPKRHPQQHITVTCVIYNTIAGGVPSEADVMAAVEDMECLYEACGQGKVGQLADAEFDFAKEESHAHSASSSSAAAAVPPIPEQTLTSAPTEPALGPPAPELPVPASGSDDMPSFASLDAFLLKIGLSEYLPQLKLLGWDDLSFLRTRSASEVKWIADEAGMKPGHAAKFMQLGETSLGVFLRERGLSVYQQKLLDLGWDDACFLRTKSESKLKEIADQVGMKPGHAAKFTQLGETSLGVFLREHGLSVYQQKLLDLGWDDACFLRTKSGKELRAVADQVGMAPGHADKFVSLLRFGGK